MKKILSLLPIITISCGSDPVDQPPPTPPKPSLQELKQKISPWVLYNPSGIVVKRNSDDGDSLLWAGLLCGSGELNQCSAVKNSQSPDGRMWRSPELMLNDTKNSFSRDMLLGYMLYLIKTKDTQSANLFIDYLDTYNNQMCSDATDSRCSITPAMWGLMRVVWNEIGLQPTLLMRMGNVLDETALLVEAGKCSDYECHLIGVKALIIKKCNKETEKIKSAINKLVEKQPENAFFTFLKNDFQKTEDLIYKYIPQTEPTDKFQWSFERNWNEYNPNHSMVAEWVFVINLLNNQ
jgi:hypothetical protein